MNDQVAWSELAPYFAARELDGIKQRVKEARETEEHRQLVERMGVIARECCRMDTSTSDQRAKWLALQHEFCEISKRLEATQ